MTKQVLFGGTDDSNSSTITEYNCVVGGGGSWTSDESTRWQFIATAGTLSNFRVDLENPPGAGNSLTYTIYQNGNPTALTVTISDSNDYDEDTTHSVNLNIEDVISIQCVPSSGPTVGNQHWALDFDSTTTDYTLLTASGASTNFSNSATRYLTMSGYSTPDTSVDDITQVVSTSGTIRDLYVALADPPGAGNSYTFTLYQNGSPTSLVVVISDGDVSSNDTTHTVSVSAGDTLYIECVPTSTPTATRGTWSCVFVPTVSGESLVMGNSSDAPSTLNDEYIELTAADTSQSWGSALLDRQVLGNVCTLKNFYVNLGTAPGSGNDYTFTLIKNGVPTALTLNISDTNTSNSDTTHAINLSDGDLLSILCSPNSSPASTKIRWGFTQLAPTGNTFAQIDNITISDVFQKFTKAKKNFIEAVSLTESIIRNLNLKKSESLALTDIFLKSLSIKKTNTDTINLNDSIRKTVGVIFSNNIVLEDALARLLKANKNILEQLFFEDDISLFVLANKILTDETILEDNVLRKVQAKIAVVENVTLTDTFSAIKLRYVTLSDTLTLSDILQLNTKAKKQFQEDVTLTDVLNKFINAQTTISDEIILVDNNTQKIFAKLSLSDDIALDDNLIKQAKIKITALDNFTLTDELLRQVMKSQLLTDLLNLTDGSTATETFRPPYWTFVRVDI